MVHQRNDAPMSIAVCLHTESVTAHLVLHLVNNIPSPSDNHRLNRNGYSSPANTEWYHHHTFAHLKRSKYFRRRFFFVYAYMYED